MLAIYNDFGALPEATFPIDAPPKQYTSAHPPLAVVGSRISRDGLPELVLTEPHWKYRKPLIVGAIGVGIGSLLGVLIGRSTKR